MSELRKSARGQFCRVRLPGICNGRPETTVLAHLNGGGTGTKHEDMFGAFCCSSCHDVVDGRVPTHIPYETVLLAFYDGMVRTQRWWIENHYIQTR